MSITEDFLSSQEEAEIISAIQEAEALTSGEIRVHIEAHSDLDVMERARQIFIHLKMHKTQLHNGVLFYVGVQDHTFAIIGDEGINRVVTNDFWECTKEIVIGHFKKGDFKNGLIKGILNAGSQLKLFFPYNKEHSTNELPDEISRG